MKESSEINQYKKICRLAGVQKLIIENPHFIESEKPTANDIEWAKKTIKQQEELRDNKVINVLYNFLFVVRKIIIIPMGILHVAFNAITFFILLNLFFGLTKANKFMDNIVLNWMELFYYYTQPKRTNP